MLLLAACTSPEKKPETTKDNMQIVLNLQPDTTLLGERVKLGDVAVDAPRGWEQVSAMMMEYMRDHAGKEAGQYRLAPEISYTHPSGSVLVLSSFANPPEVEFAQFAMRVGAAYRAARAELNPQEQWITLNGLRALQVYAATESAVHLKIILGAGQPLSLDYTIPRQEWAAQRRAVESSIGSARVMTPEEALR